MYDRQAHRGFSITVSTRNDAAGGSHVTLLIEQICANGDDVRGGAPIPEPEHYHLLLTGPAAAGEAMQRVKRAIDDALGDPDPLDEL
ncbi:hypothetical protein [Paraburkholderia aromaticivorans]|uniref:hypothetical protein n=1 Tax=Paraburkholderia aromaticivorans TaxID=2026199 RepID=UPI001455E84B|nr:hypothetical protein [Paraburkholderia aromaticivorans]